MLEEWALPDDLLDRAPESPYGWSPELWKRRSQIAREEASDTPTVAALRAMLPERGSLLDVGAGTGRASIAFAVEGVRVTGVEKNPELSAEFRRRAAEEGVIVTAVDGTWPEVAGSVGIHDVAVCAHVVYDVQVAGPFLTELVSRTRIGVVVELTPEHPWSGLTPYYLALHGLTRPAGPTYVDFLDVVTETCGVRPEFEVWIRRGQVWFESWDEILDHYQKRLVLSEDRRGELRELLSPEVEADGGRWFVGSRDRTIVTVWWPT
jgi:SAM-dependent methyltransferase